MYILKWFRFIIAKIYNILRYTIRRIIHHMCNLHLKETEISQKRSKGIKNWKITYSVLSNKTSLILGFSSPWTEFLCLSSFPSESSSDDYASELHDNYGRGDWLHTSSPSMKNNTETKSRSTLPKSSPSIFKFQLLPGKFIKIAFDRLALLALFDR